MKAVYGIVAVFALLAGCVSVEVGRDLRAESVMLAATGSQGEMNAAEPDSFRPGDEVSVVYLNVEGLQKGEDGLYWYDLDMVLKDVSGKVLFTQEDLLGEGGHRELAGGIAKSPAGTVTTYDEMPKGVYTLTVTLKDKVSGKSLTESREFTLK